MYGIYTEASQHVSWAALTGRAHATRMQINI